MPQTVLVVDDEPQIVKILSGYLEKGGFRVVTASDSQQAIAQHKREKPDLVLLDLNLPGPDGLEVAQRIRAAANTPLIMVTARVEEADRLIGLEVGADDYITKPFSPREVVARVRAVLRRAGAQAPSAEIIHAADVEVDAVRHSARRGETVLDLTPTEFAILATLAREPGRAFTRLQLLEAAQGETFEGYERTVDAHIKNLRAKLEHNPRQPEYILTVFGIGYKFNES